MIGGSHLFDDAWAGRNSLPPIFVLRHVFSTVADGQVFRGFEGLSIFLAASMALVRMVNMAETK